MKINNHKKLFTQNGFSLLEILIAIAIVGLAFSLVVFKPSSERQKIQEAMENVVRAIEFAKSEAVIRNKIVRVKLDLTKRPHEYLVETSDSSQLTLPQYVDKEKLGKKELEEFEKTNQALDSGFIPVEEFKKSAKEMNEDIIITGVATNLSKKMVTDEPAYIYFYPTGFQDTALIMMANYDEIISLEIESVRERVMDKYHTLNDFLDEEYEKTINDQSEKIYENWTKENEIR